MRDWEIAELMEEIVKANERDRTCGCSSWKTCLWCIRMAAAIDTLKARAQSEKDRSAELVRRFPAMAIVPGLVDEADNDDESDTCATGKAVGL